MAQINIKDKEFLPNRQKHINVNPMTITAFSKTANDPHINGYIYHIDNHDHDHDYQYNHKFPNKYMLLNKPVIPLLPRSTIKVQSVNSIPEQLSLPGVPAALVCRDDIDQDDYCEHTQMDNVNFGQYVPYNKDERFVCAEGKHYFRVLDGDKHGRGLMMIIVANYKQGLPTEVSCYKPYLTYDVGDDDDGDGGYGDGDVRDIKDITDREAIVDRVFHQLYDDYGYPKALTIKFTNYYFDFDENRQLFKQLRYGDGPPKYTGDIIESWSFNKTKFFGIHSKYINNKIIEWAMLDGNSEDHFDGLRILNVIGDFKENGIKISYHIKGNTVTPQQYIDHIKNLSLMIVLGDTKQPNITSLLMEYSNTTHIKSNLIEAKKVLAPYIIQPAVIEALQVIDIAVKLL